MVWVRFARLLAATLLICPPADKTPLRRQTLALINILVFLRNTYIFTLYSIATAVADVALVIWCAIEIVNIVFTAISNLNIFEVETTLIIKLETGHPGDPSICQWGQLPLHPAIRTTVTAPVWWACSCHLCSCLALIPKPPRNNICITFDAAFTIIHVSVSTRQVFVILTF